MVENVASCGKRHSQKPTGQEIEQVLVQQVLPIALVIDFRKIIFIRGLPLSAITQPQEFIKSHMIRAYRIFSFTSMRLLFFSNKLLLATLNKRVDLRVFCNREAVGGRSEEWEEVVQMAAMESSFL